MKHTFHKLHRALALALALLMLISCLPTTALAEIIQKNASGGIMLMSLLPVEPRATYTFYDFVADDAPTGEYQPVQTQILRNGESLLAPQAKSYDGYKFMGWSADNGSTYQSFGAQTVSKDVDIQLYAVYKEVHYVFFMDKAQGEDNIRVYKTKEGVTGDSITTTDVKLPVEDVKKSLVGWKDASGNTVGENYTVQSKDTFLYPDIQEGHWITFVAEDDASYTAPQFVPVGETGIAPTQPTRPGYKFKQWNLESSSYGFDRTLDGDIELKAVWTPDKANYTVLYWKDNADWDNANLAATQRPKVQYAFVGSDIQTGTTNSQTNVGKTLPSSLTDDFNDDLNGFTARSVSQEPIHNDGSTVVNVYFDRNVYTIKFLDNAGNENGLIAGTNIKGGTGIYRIDAKYGYYIARLSPNNPNNNCGTSWNVNPNNGNWEAQTGITTMPLGGGTYYQRPARNMQATATYYRENLAGDTSGKQKNGKYFSVDHQETIGSSQVAHVTEADYKRGITGFTLNRGMSSTTTDTFGGAEFYFTRNSYHIEYFSENHEIHRTTFQFEANTSSAANYKPTGADVKKTIQGDSYTFDGWYLDPEFKTKADFSGIMPAYDYIVYAKWVMPEVDATVHVKLHGAAGEDETRDTDHAQLKYGQSLQEAGYNSNSWLFTPDEVYRAAGITDTDNYTWHGWVKEDGSPFNFNEKLYKHVDLYPSYSATGPFKLTYDANGGSGTAPTDDTKYRGSSAAHVKTSGGLTPPQGKVFLGWSENPSATQADLIQPGDKYTIDEDSTLYAIWGPVPEGAVLRYHSNWGDDKVASFDLDLNNEKVAVRDYSNDGLTYADGKQLPTRPGYTFVGWSENPGASPKDKLYHKNDELIVTNENNNYDNDLYAIWERDTGTITIVKVVEGPLADANDAFSFTAARTRTDATEDESDTGYSADATITGQGQTTITVPTGDYTVTETKVPADYNKDKDATYKYEPAANEDGTVTVPAGGNVTVTVTNYRNDEDPKNDKDIKDAEYDVTVTVNGNKEDMVPVGGKITYTISYKNPSHLTSTVTITDPLNEYVGFVSATESGVYNDADHTVTWTIPNVGPFATGSVEVTVEVLDTVLQLATPMVDNQAKVDIVDQNGKDWHETTPDPETPVEDPDWTVTKAVSGMMGSLSSDGITKNAQVGDVLTYTITVVNTGNVDLKDLDFSDIMDRAGTGDQKTFLLADATVTGDGVAANGEKLSIEVGATATITYTYTVLPTDEQLHNTALVGGKDPDVTVEVDPKPAYKLEKDLIEIIPGTKVTEGREAGKAYVGDTLKYRLTITNKGNTILDLNITDTVNETFEIDLTNADHAGEGTFAAPWLNDLPINGVATLTYTYEVQDTDREVDNYALATNPSDPDDDPDDPDHHDETETPIERKPGLKVEKTRTNNPTKYPAEGYLPDETITFEITIENTGNVTLYNVVAKDDLKGIVFSDPQLPTEDSPLTLKPGDKVTFTCSYLVSETDYVDSNKKTVDGVEKYYVTNTVHVTANPEDPDDPTKPDLSTTLTGEDDADAPLKDLHPGLVIDKYHDPDQETDMTANPPAYKKVGDIVEFKIKVGNMDAWQNDDTSDNMTLTNVTVTDDKAYFAQEDADNSGGRWKYVAEKEILIPVLAPGEVIEIKAYHKLTQADLNAGNVHNIAIATAPDPRNPGDPDDPDNPGDPPLTDTDDDDIPVAQNPALFLEKSVMGAQNHKYSLGETVTYEVLVRNDGNVTLTDVEVKDALFATATELTIDPNENPVHATHASGSDTVTIDTMAPGKAYLIRYRHQVTQAEVDAGWVRNVATATGHGPDPDKDPDPQEDHEDVPTERHPAIEVVKEADNPTHKYKLGETVYYTLTITNTGDVTLKDITVTDTLFKYAVETPQAYVAKPGAGYQAKFNRNDGTDKDGEMILTNIMLAPNARCVITYSYKVTQEDVEAGKVYNVVTATGTPTPREKKDPNDPYEPEPTPDDPVTSTDDETVETLYDPGLTVTKTADKTIVSEVGEVITYTIVVENTGNVLLKDIDVLDELDDKDAADIANAPFTDIVSTDKATGVTFAGNTAHIDSLEPTGSVTFTASYTVTQEDLDAGNVGNLATASAPDPRDPDDPPIEDDDPEDVPTDQNPSIDLEKELANSPENGVAYVLDEEIEYEIVVTNNGNVTLHDVIIEDGLDDAEITSVVLPTGDTYDYAYEENDDGSITVNFMAPGDVVTLNVTYKVKQSDIDATRFGEPGANGKGVGYVANHATADGKDPNDDPVHDSDDVIVKIPHNPDLSIVKDLINDDDGNKLFKANDVAKFDITVENTGNITLHHVYVTDSNLPAPGAKIVENDDYDPARYSIEGPLVALIDEMAPGEVVVVKAEYVVTQADIDDNVTELKNIATADSDETDEKTDDEDIPEEPQDPAFTLLKETTSEPANGEAYVLGERITYSITVTNTGNVTLNNVVVTDELTYSQWTVNVLEVGESRTLKTSYVVKEADVAAGHVVNVATATGKGPDPENPPKDPPPSETDDPTVPMVDRSVTKTWVGDEGHVEDTRPDRVTVQLYRDGVAYRDPVTLSDANGWSYTWTGLPKYDGRLFEANEPLPPDYTYTVLEVPSLRDYVATYDVSADGITTTVTNTYNPPRTSRTVYKDWRDVNNRDGLRPNSIQVQLYADGVAYDDPVTLTAPNWSHTWTGLLTYRGRTQETIVYTVEEIGVPDGYTTSETASGAFITITNTHIPEPIDISVEKVWDDGDNVDETRTDSVEVALVADGMVVDTVTLDASNEWKHTWTELDVSRNDRLINYTVDETNGPAGYTKAVTSTQTETGYAFVVTNSYTPMPEFAEIEGTKVWVDQSDVRGLRPDAIQLTVSQNGTAMDPQPVPTWTRDGNIWTYRFTNLPYADENHQPYTYTVDEVPVENYTTEVDGYTIVNTVIPQTIVIEGTKTWNDDNNAAGLRPAYIVVRLMRQLGSGTPELVATQTVMAAHGWYYRFADLPDSDPVTGQLYTYSISENLVTGYYMTVDGYDLINTLIPTTPGPGPGPGPGGTPTPTPAPGGNPTVTIGDYDTPLGITQWGTPTEEQLEDLVELDDYDTPLWGELLQTGDDLPVYPFVFGGIGILSLMALLVLELKKRKKEQ